jgi:hypothetical protein
MRKTTLFAAAAALALSGSMANAAITVTSTRVAGTGADSAYDIVRFFAKAVPGTAEDASTGLQSAAITLSTFAAGSTPTFHFKFSDQNSDTFPDWDPTGKGSAGSGGTVGSALTNTTTIGSFVGVRPYDKPGNQQGSFDLPPGSGVYPMPASPTNSHDGPKSSFDADGDGTLGSDPGDVDPVALYQDKLTSFRVEGFNSVVDPSLLSSDANGGRGALFAVGVVPHGAAVQAQGVFLPNFTAGGLATPSTSPQNIDFVDTGTNVPEPTSMALLGLGAMGFLARRRRQA